MEEQQLFFDERFLEKYAGTKILNDPVTAVIELIANAWDAGSTIVKIIYPEEDGDSFSVQDDGCGLSSEEFEKIWSTLYYNRIKNIGVYAIDRDSRLSKKRFAFGRNGVGRCAAFCFGQEYEVISRKNGREIHYLVTSLDTSLPFKFNKITEVATDGVGTRIIVKNAKTRGMNIENLRSEIGMRFITDPEFEIFLQNKRITFEDIDKDNVEDIELEIDGYGTVCIKIIDTHDTDKTTNHHGIAWRVNNRLVGDISWSKLSASYNVDGRRVGSKRYSFIIFADNLVEYVLSDWSGFDTENELVKTVEKNVYTFIWKKLIELTKGQRQETFDNVKKTLSSDIKKMTPLKVEKWSEFIVTTQEKCPSISEKELVTIGSILANLEISSSKYSLLDQLQGLTPDQLDDLDTILKTWSVDYAKIVLDELQSRLTLLSRLQETLDKIKSDEVHELQPLFERGLWIFGPEYETIEYTSNRGMTKVIQNLFGASIAGSKKRPDFAVLSKSSVGLYSYPKYDEDGAEIGTDRLVIIELKAPGVPISANEIAQPYKYIKELFDKGLLQRNISKVMCFVIGDSIDDSENGETTKMNNTVIIRPLLYDIVIKRAKSRLFNLFDKLKEAPFFNEIENDYVKCIEEKKEDLFA